MWERLERIPYWQDQEGRRSLSSLWQRGWRWSFVLGVRFSPILHVWELPEFLSIMSLDRSKWPRCLLWHGWLLGLRVAVIGFLGLLLLGNWLVVNWNVGLCPITGMLMIFLALQMPDAPNIWTDGCREDFSSTGP